jgi:hypothetical protein
LRMKECQLSDVEANGAIALSPTSCDGRSAKLADPEIEALIKSVTDAVMETIGSGK